jgi:hypothetical protein
MPAGKRPRHLSRFSTLNHFVDECLAVLTRDMRSPSAGLVWLCLFRIANAKTRIAFGASVVRLSTLTGLDRKTVQAAIRVLADEAFITVVPGGGRGKVAKYTVHHHDDDDAD